MSTTGTTGFNLEFKDIAEEAFERCGVEMRTGYHLRTARRSLNLLTIEWANRGINLWTIEQGEIPMVTGQVSYTLPVDTIDLLDHVIRNNNGTSNQIDINITRISESSYAMIPNKLANGRPIQVWINRQSGNTNATPSTTLNGAINSTATTINVASTANLPSAGYITVDNEVIGYTTVSGNQLQGCVRGQANTTAVSHLTGVNVYTSYIPNINVWPSPNAPGDQYTFVYWRMRRLQDAGSGTRVQDIPFRFIPCMTAGLAYQLAIKIPEAAGRIDLLKREYEEQWKLAADEDREKASLRLAPRQMFW